MSKLPPSPFIYPLTDRIMSGCDDIGDLVRELAAAGARLVQLREKDLTTREFREIALAAVRAVGACGVKLLVNDRVDVAMLSGADGVHLGDEDLPPADARKLLGPEAIVGVSCHSIDDVRAAASQPVDYIAVGPVFPTSTKQVHFPVVGLELVRRARQATDLPLVAIGGIGLDTAAQVAEAGADGIAVISALMVPGEIGARTRSFIDALAKPL